MKHYCFNRRVVYRLLLLLPLYSIVCIPCETVEEIGSVNPEFEQIYFISN